ncbi:NDP-hexose 2,3-dehydratase family protein [Halanaerobium congolense]|jgi:oxidase EvaA|uniref:Oxidase EvaA n=1 Tax=Halanaerobium congolense TaxID=54121 RepID=A0A1G6QFN7_9FIRM|nr:NDP-hexose 2,3-dehydratase family protein [Halanaerobium congolense]SDC91113.1 oxidase EvaA [Halanaerobium congolense]
MKFSDYIKFLNSELNRNNIEDDSQILEWIENKNKSIKTNIKRSNLSELNNWFYDERIGNIKHRSGNFFSILGIEISSDNKIHEQPIIKQPEIGFLGIIVKEIDNIFYFLMQAKIEPGNINKVQISPTLQATKSNFQQIHKGSKPKYFEYFKNAKPKNILFDTLQSEQGNKFLKKRNRNIVVKVTNDIEVLDNYKWMSLRQIKHLMKYDNYVNMDTRTVISNIQYNFFENKFTQLEKETIKNKVRDNKFAKSMIAENGFYIDLIEVKNDMNNIKMLDNTKIRKKKLHELKAWQISDNIIYNKIKKGFQVIFCDIEIEGREVNSWGQPLLKPAGIELIAFLVKDINGIKHFLCKYTKEPGIFDTVEIGPTLHVLEEEPSLTDYVSNYTYNKIHEGENIIKYVLLSEEGGRFYHEENRNIILEADNELKINKICEKYKWLTLGQINFLINNDSYVNIQARNLTALISMGD